MKKNDKREKFTPGPWFCTCIGHVKECMGDPPKTVATIPGFCSEVKIDGITEKQANADLIAAAPEMYSLLKEMLSSDRCDIAYFKISVENVLKKARGEER